MQCVLPTNTRPSQGVRSPARCLFSCSCYAISHAPLPRMGIHGQAPSYTCTFNRHPACIQASAVGEQPSSAQPPTPVKKSWFSSFSSETSLSMLTSIFQVITKNIWLVLFVYLLKDIASFGLHRIFHRLTNAVADSVLGLSIVNICNPWWLHLDGAFLEQNIGYQVVMGAIFVLTSPCLILLNSLALTVTTLVVTRQAQQEQAVQAALTDPPAHSSLEAAATATAAAQPETSSPPSSSPEPHAASASADAPQASLPAASASSPGPAGQAPPAQPATASVPPAPAPPSDPSTAATVTSSSEQPASVPSSPAAGGSSSSSSSDPSSPLTSTAADSSSSPPKRGWFASMRAGLGTIGDVLPDSLAMLRRVWWVDLLFNVQAMPLQLLSLLVLPVVWSVPRLMAIQLAVPVAILEGLSGQAALKRSAELMEGNKASYAVPFVGILLVSRLVDGVRNSVMALVPPRWWQDVIEVPLLILAVFMFVKIVLARMQDIMSLPTYLRVAKEQGKNKSE